MIAPNEAKVTQWGTKLGIKLPKEFTSKFNLKHKSTVRIEIRDGILLVMPPPESRKRKPLADILASGTEKGEWNGEPAEISEEDRLWLDSPSEGAEVVDKTKTGRDNFNQL